MIANNCQRSAEFEMANDARIAGHRSGELRNTDGEPENATWQCRRENVSGLD